MTRIFAIIVLAAKAVKAVEAGPPQPLAEKFLHSGQFAEGETALLLALDADPENDEARFGLGVVQFVRAVENLGEAMYEYGAVSEKASQIFLRIPVPENPKPLTISYKSLGRVLDKFSSDVCRAEATLAEIKDDQVKLRLRLGKITFDFAQNRAHRTTLLEILNKLNGGRFNFQQANPEFRVHFDRGDVGWLRGYCHVLAASVDAYRAIDDEAGFDARVSRVFPKVQASDKERRHDDWQGLRVSDAPRLRRMRLHLVAVTELNRESWKHIRKETDDDYEWLPHPNQTDQLGLPLTENRIDGWLSMMAQWEGLLKGERLISSNLMQMVKIKHKPGHGLNLRKLLDNPPPDLFNYDRLQRQGANPAYLEIEKGKPVLDLNAILNMAQLFDGPFGVAYAVRLN